MAAWADVKDKFRIDPSRVQLVPGAPLLGQGAFGSVLEARLDGNVKVGLLRACRLHPADPAAAQLQVAVKKLQEAHNNAAFEQEVATQLALTLQCSRTCRSFGYVIHEGQMCVVMKL
jgi:hypothetical protein